MKNQDTMVTAQRVATLAIALCTTRAVGAFFLSTKAARCISPALLLASSRYSTTTTALGSVSSRDDNGPHTLTEPLAPIDSLARPSALQRLRLRLGYGKSLRERVV